MGLICKLWSSAKSPFPNETTHKGPSEVSKNSPGPKPWRSRDKPGLPRNLYFKQESSSTSIPEVPSCVVLLQVTPNDSLGRERKRSLRLEQENLGLIPSKVSALSFVPIGSRVRRDTYECLHTCVLGLAPRGSLKHALTLLPHRRLPLSEHGLSGASLPVLTQKKGCFINTRFIPGIAKTCRGSGLRQTV